MQMRLRFLGCTLVSLALGACTSLPGSGPTTADVIAARRSHADIQVLEVNSELVRQLRAAPRGRSFADIAAFNTARSYRLGPGDVIEVSIWEAIPATLFGAVDLRSGVAPPSRATNLPEQVIGQDGFITVPFAGKIRAAGRTAADLERDIAMQLAGKANQPEVLVRVVRPGSSIATVIGEVTNSLRFPIGLGSERVLDAVAATAGLRQPINKVALQLTRGTDVVSMPMVQLLRDPQQNILLAPGDVLAAINQPLSFTALGASGRNEEVSFEASGISAAQALARAGGLADARANPGGVFIFRLEAASTVEWPSTPTKTSAGTVPVVYRFDLREPTGFVMLQQFAMNDGDLLYVANAPAAELQKFLNVAFSVAYPLLTAAQASK